MTTPPKTLSTTRIYNNEARITKTMNKFAFLVRARFKPRHENDLKYKNCDFKNRNIS